VIETFTAQNGSLVIRLDGRLLASAVDPLAEAREWVQRRRILLTKVKSIFVLGAGSGYHVAELLIQTDANIVVIERSPELVAAVQRIQGFESKCVQFVSVEKSAALRGHEQVRAAVNESFLVLQHAPSLANDQEFYRDCKNQLLGRDWGSLNWQWQLKGFAPLDAQPKIHAAGETQLSIYDLEQTELVQNSIERERMLVKALRELVK
jgi:hypothetical protein